ncbi:MAG: helix-turn-helix domain-containing protein [Terracidiphilus sp.]
MPSGKVANKPGHITTGNVLEDLGFSAEEVREMEIKHEIWVPIRAEIEAQKLTQAQLARTLQIHQPDASLLLRGQIARFSITRLLQFADRLQLAVTLTVAPREDSDKVSRAARIPMRRSEGRRQSATPAIKPRRSAALA